MCQVARHATCHQFHTQKSELGTHYSTVKLPDAEGMPTAGGSNLDAEAACSASLEHVLLSIVGARLHWLHQQLLDLQYTCLKPDADEAEVIIGLQPACLFSGQPLCMPGRSQDIVYILCCLSICMPAVGPQGHIKIPLQDVVVKQSCVTCGLLQWSAIMCLPDRRPSVQCKC